MFEVIKKWWKDFAIILAMCAFAFNYLELQHAEAANAEKQAKYDETFEQIKKIADDVSDPNKPLRDFLILRNIDKEIARYWSSFPKNKVVDSTGKVLPISFLNRELLPEIGVEMRPDGDSTKIVDTLWNFK